jgi:hypothetical protein
MHHRTKITGVTTGLVLLTAPVRLLAGCESGTPASPNALVSPPNAPPDAGPTRPCVQAAMPDGGGVTLTGRLVSLPLDGGPDAAAIPIENGVIALEYGGRDLVWCDLSKGTPWFVFGGVTNDAGEFTIEAKQGKLGLHAFATDHFTTTLDLDTTDAGDGGNAGEAGVGDLALARRPAAEPKIKIEDAKLNLRAVKAGEALIVSARITAGSAAAPLSGKTILVDPAESWSVALDPPSAGTPGNFSNGVWERIFAAPRTPGDHTFYLVATSADGASSDVQTLSVIVR